jgi:hypothetical protein
MLTYTRGGSDEQMTQAGPMQAATIEPGRGWTGLDATSNARQQTAAAQLALQGRRFGNQDSSVRSQDSHQMDWSL